MESPQKITSYDENELRLYINKIEEIAKKLNIDVVIFDCAPTLDNLIGIIAKYSNYNLLITETTNVAFRGTEHLKTLLTESYKAKTESMKIILNKADKTYLFTELGGKYKTAIKKLLEVVDVIGIIPFDNRIIKTFEEENQFYIETIPNSLATKQLKNILNNIMCETHLKDKITIKPYEKGSAIRLNVSEIMLFRFIIAVS